MASATQVVDDFGATTARALLRHVKVLKSTNDRAVALKAILDTLEPGLARRVQVDSDALKLRQPFGYLEKALAQNLSRGLVKQVTDLARSGPLPLGASTSPPKRLWTAYAPLAGSEANGAQPLGFDIGDAFGAIGGAIADAGKAVGGAVFDVVKGGVGLVGQGACAVLGSSIGKIGVATAGQLVGVPAPAGFAAASAAGGLCGGGGGGSQPVYMPPPPPPGPNWTLIAIVGVGAFAVVALATGRRRSSPQPT